MEKLHTSFPKTMLTEEQELELFNKVKNGDRKVMETVIFQYKPIVYKMARKLSGYGLDSDELISEGMLALTQAAIRFDMSMNFRFATYAYRWVSGTMLTYVVNNYFMAKQCVNQKNKSLFFSLRRILADYTKETNENNEISEEIIDYISSQFNVSETDIRQMYASIMSPYISMSSPIKTSEDIEGSTIEDIIPDENAKSPEITTILDNQQMFHSSIINDAIKVLSDREKYIFEHRRLQDKPDTLEYIGEKMKISKERVRQIENVAFKKIQKAVKNILENSGNTVQDLF